MIKKYGPWEIKSSKVVYKNPWMKVIEDKVIRPDKKLGIYAVAKIQPGVSILPIDKKGYVYLVREFKYPLGKYTIVAAGGGREKNEKPIATAKRELEEELGIRAKKWAYVGKYDPATGIVDCPQHLFIAENLTFTNKNYEGTETMTTVKTKLDEALKLIKQGKITEGEARVLLLEAKLRQLKQRKLYKQNQFQNLC